MLTLDEVKQYLHLDSDAEDDYINILILLAAEMCRELYKAALAGNTAGKLQAGNACCYRIFL